jgi:hypothetical protein
MLTDGRFRERVCEQIRSPDFTVLVTDTGDRAEVTIEQTQLVRKVPSFATRLVGDRVDIRQVERWNSPTMADFDVTIPGRPGHLRGQMSLSTVGDGTTQQVSGDLKIHVPLVGGKLEGLIAGLLKLAMDAEQEVGRRWLAGDR